MVLQCGVSCREGLGDAGAGGVEVNIFTHEKIPLKPPNLNKMVLILELDAF